MCVGVNARDGIVRKSVLEGGVRRKEKGELVVYGKMKDTRMYKEQSSGTINK